MRILYAEDERGLSEAVVDILVYHNYAVDAVYDGETVRHFEEIVKTVTDFVKENTKKTL